MSTVEALSKDIRRRRPGSVCDGLSRSEYVIKTTRGTVRRTKVLLPTNSRGKGRCFIGQTQVSRTNNVQTTDIQRTDNVHTTYRQRTDIGHTTYRQRTYNGQKTCVQRTHNIQITYIQRTDNGRQRHSSCGRRAFSPSLTLPAALFPFSPAPTLLSPRSPRASIPVDLSHPPNADQCTRRYTSLTGGQCLTAGRDWTPRLISVGLLAVLRE